MALVQIADETWGILRQEGAIIEESLKYSANLLRSKGAIIEEVPEEDGDDNSLKEKVDEGVTSPSDTVAGTSFNEKSGGLHG